MGGKKALLDRAASRYRILLRTDGTYRSRQGTSYTVQYGENCGMSIHAVLQPFPTFTTFQAVAVPHSHSTPHTAQAPH